MDEVRQQALKDLEVVNDYVGTSLLDEKLRWWAERYKNNKTWYLRFQLNSNKFVVVNRLGARIF